MKVCSISAEMNPIVVNYQEEGPNQEIVRKKLSIGDQNLPSLSKIDINRTTVKKHDFNESFNIKTPETVLSIVGMEQKELNPPLFFSPSQKDPKSIDLVCEMQFSVQNAVMQDDKPKGLHERIVEATLTREESISKDKKFSDAFIGYSRSSSNSESSISEHSVRDERSVVNREEAPSSKASSGARVKFWNKPKFIFGSLENLSEKEELLDQLIIEDHLSFEGLKVKFEKELTHDDGYKPKQDHPLSTSLRSTSLREITIEGHIERMDIHTTESSESHIFRFTNIYHDEDALELDEGINRLSNPPRKQFNRLNEGLNYNQQEKKKDLISDRTILPNKGSKLKKICSSMYFIPSRNEGTG